MEFVNNESSFSTKKTYLMESNFFNPGSELEKGKCETNSIALHHLCANIKIPIIDEDDLNVVHYDFQKTCESLNCGKCLQSIIIPNTAVVIDLNNDLDYTISIQSLVRDYFTNLKRSYTCVECGTKMNEINTPTKLPLLLFINFSGKEFMFEAEKELNLFDTLYELVYIVYWGGGHFITRMNTPLGQYEYDGMKNDGKFQSMEKNNFFVGKMIDFYGQERTAVGATYRKK
jgi:hypothetical protein